MLWEGTNALPMAGIKLYLVQTGERSTRTEHKLKLLKQMWGEKKKTSTKPCPQMAKKKTIQITVIKWCGAGIYPMHCNDHKARGPVKT